MALQDILDYTIFGNDVTTYIIAGVIFAAFVFGFKLVRFSVISFLKRFAKKTKTDIDDLVIKMLESINWIFFIILSAYIASQWIAIPEAADKWLNYGFMIAVVIFIVLTLLHLVDYFKEKIVRNKADENAAVIKFLSTLLKGGVWLIAFLIVLANMGVNITALVAALGVGGIAIAFALQNILEDLFSSVSIYFDKPFKKGDFIILENQKYMGTVKDVGMKTTRLESLWGEELVVSNKELTSTKISNYKRMHKRRIHFNFGVVYQTKVSKMKKIPEMVKEIFDSIDKVELDRVHFKEFGDSALNFEVAYYVDSKEYNDYMDKQQEINLAIMDKFEKQKIGFAYPTQTVFINK